MIHKNIKYFIIILFVLITLCSCNQADSPAVKPTDTALPADSVQPTAAALSFRITWADYSGRGAAIQKIVNTYDSNNPGAITMVGGDEDIQTIQTLLDSKASILYVLPYRYVEYFSAKGYLWDLTETFQAEKSAFYPQVWNLGSVNGLTYGIPWLGHAMCLLYNQTLLQKAGVDATSINSLSTLVLAMEQVEKSTDAKGFGLVGASSNDISWMVNQFIYGFGGSLVSDDGKTVSINSEQSRSAIDFYKNVLGAHAQSTWLEDTGTEVMNYFRNQEVAFEIQGIWGVTDIQKNGDPFDVGVIPMADVGLCAEVGPMMLAIPADLSEPQLSQAIAFIRYLISPEAQEQILHGEYSPERDAYYPFRTPIRNDMANDKIFQAYPDYYKFVEGFQNPSIDVPVAAWQTVKDDYYGPGLHKVMSGELPIDDFLAQIETEGNRILKSN
jgi:multiple sugar transport system substrate-binding protein